jgi:hypothetical protein
MSKIPECDSASALAELRCSFYAHSPDLVCAVHPFGIDDDSCLDFRLNPNLKAEELWTPEVVI